MQKSMGARCGMLLTLCLCWTLTGCVKNDQKAQDAAKAFMEAAQKQDKEALKATLTAKARQKFSENANMTLTPNRSKTTGYEVGQATITDEEAVVPITMKTDDRDQKGHLKLRREEGQWKVYALAVTIPEMGSEFTIDFENPEAALGEIFKGMGKAVGESMKGMGKAMGEGMKGFAQGFQDGIKDVKPSGDGAGPPQAGSPSSGK